MFKYIAQSLKGSLRVLSVNPLSYYNKYIKDQQVPEIYKNFEYIEFDSPLKYNEIDSKCPFILYNKVWIIELKVSDLSNQEKEIYNLHKKVKHKKMPWWKNEI
tara:strand:+ start:1867 stop:2175 length:309 start_codon:yes stop_codon:yes gene_type:complete